MERTETTTITAAQGDQIVATVGCFERRQSPVASPMQMQLRHSKPIKIGTQASKGGCGCNNNFSKMIGPPNKVTRASSLARSLLLSQPAQLLTGQTPNASSNAHAPARPPAQNTGLVLGGKRRVQLNLIIKRNNEVE